MERKAGRGEKIIRLLLVLVGVVTALIGGYLVYYGLTQWFDLQRGTYLMYGFLVLILLVYVFLALPRERRIQLTAKTVSVLRCNRCGASIVREFERGDYVFKEEGVCGKCGSGTYFIEEIFEAPLRKRKSKRRDRTSR